MADGGGGSVFFFQMALTSTTLVNLHEQKKILQEPLEAIIWAHDRASGGLVLASAGSTPLVHNVRVTSESAVSKVLSAEAPSPAAADGDKNPSSSSSSADAAATTDATTSSSSLSAFFDPLAKLPALDEARCRERLERAVQAAAARAAKVGVGVSRRAQAAFDALDKTLPCAWGESEGDRGTIYVLGEVAVKGPDYDSGSASVVEGGAGAEAAAAAAESAVEASKARQALERVRMVLDAAKDELPPP